jgi:hypothetical protein
MELPIVAFRVSGVVDAVADGVTGRLVDALDVEGLTSALQAYLEDDTLRTQHGQSGRRHVAALFSRDLVWRTLLGFYSSLARQHSSTGDHPSTSLGVTLSVPTGQDGPSDAEGHGNLPARATACTDAA